MKPFVAVGMIEVPVRVDEVRDGVGSETSERLLELRTRYTDSGIDQHFAVGPSQHSNVSARALKHADVKRVLVRLAFQGL
jgi:hypothetical protein